MVGYRSNTPSEYMRKHMNMDISANMTGHLKMTVEDAKEALLNRYNNKMDNCKAKKKAKRKESKKSRKNNK